MNHPDSPHRACLLFPGEWEGCTVHRALLWHQDITEMVLANDWLPESSWGLKQPTLRLLIMFVCLSLDGLETSSGNCFNKSHRRCWRFLNNGFLLCCKGYNLYHQPLSSAFIIYVFFSQYRLGLSWRVLPLPWPCSVFVSLCCTAWGTASP